MNNIGNIVHDNLFLRSQLTDLKANLNIAHFNAQSFNVNPKSSKLSEIRNIVEDSLIDIVGVSETWLKPSILSNAVNITGFSLCRNDRPLHRGGGVALYISDNLSYNVVYAGNNYGVLECLFIEVMAGSEKILVGVVYLPHGDFGSFESEISDLLVRYRNIVIMGDFNNNLFDISRASNVRRVCARLGVSVMHNKCPTHYDTFHQSSSLIDYFLVSLPNNIKSSGQFVCPNISRHAFIYISLIASVRRCQQYFEFYDYNHFNIEELRDRVTTSNLSEIFSTPDVNEQLNIFMIGLENIQSVFGKKMGRVRQSSNNWMKCPLVRYHESMSDLAYSAFIDSRTVENWKTFCKIRNRAKTIKRREKRRAHSEMFDENMPPKSLWRIIGNNGLIGKNPSESGPATSIDVNDMNMSFVGNQLDVQEDVERFLRFSCSDEGFSFSSINSLELFEAFSSIKSNVAGNDGFSLKFLRIVFPYVSNYFLHLVNTIVMTSSFPNGWKTAKINPIKKKSHVNDVQNLRPIALLPILSKIVEHVLKKQLLSYIESKSLLNDCQCGFRSGRSTSMLLIGLTDSIRHNLADHKMSVLLSLDLEKAFDRVNYFSLVYKLSNMYGFGSSACKLIYSYLRDRKQYVHFNGFSSSILSVRSGVPQGSVLGPLLFILFLNDLFDSIDDWCLPYAYADDVQLLFSGEYQYRDVLQAKIDYVLRSLNTWMVSNNLSVNASKTKALLFSSCDVDDLHLKYNNVQIDFVHNMKCLGVTLDDSLSFDLHIDGVVARTNFGLRQLYNTDLVLPRNVKEKLVHALIMPNILYCLEVYSGSKKRNMRRIQLAFNRVVRYLYSIRRYDHVTPSVNRFLGCNFSSFVDFRSLLLFYKMFKSRKPLFLMNSFAFCRSLRTNQLKIPRARGHMDRSFQVRIARLFNLLPSSLRIFNHSSATYRYKLLQHFGEISQ